MNLRAVAIATSVTVFVAGTATAATQHLTDPNPDVAYNIVLLKDGKVAAARTIVGRFGHEVTVEVPNLMRVSVSAKTPDASAQSLTVARMAIFHGGILQPSKEMSMMATLTMTPSFEYDVQGSPYRFVVMPRRIIPAHSD